jgi:hypothetical protein
MKIKLLLPAVLLLCAGSLHAQDPAVLRFQQAHPEVICIEAADLPRFDPYFLETYRSHILVFEKELRPADVEAFQMRQKAGVATPNVAIVHQQQEIKDWLGMHPDVTIVPQSVAIGLTDAERLALEEIGALFLIGEEVTYEDIRNYPH